MTVALLGAQSAGGLEFRGGVALDERCRILIAEDEDLYAEALALLLARDERLEVVGRARNGREAVDLAAALAPDAVLMDIDMPLMDGAEATKLIRRRHPDIGVIIVSGSRGSGLTAARAAGAHGFVPKAEAAVELIDVVLELGCGTLPLAATG